MLEPQTNKIIKEYLLNFYLEGVILSKKPRILLKMRHLSTVFVEVCKLLRSLSSSKTATFAKNTTAIEKQNRLYVSFTHN